MGTKGETKKESVDLPKLFRHFEEGRGKPDVGSSSFNERMEDLGVREKESTIKWRSRFSKFMMTFLSVQYVVVVIFLFFQGFSFKGFDLDNYIFYILIVGTLAESYFLVRIIFQYLFSVKK